MKFAFESVPQPSQCTPVCEGIGWYRMPLPFALDHVNCWLLGEPGQQTLIDTGVNNRSTRDNWRVAFDDMQSCPEQLLVTHFHPDHMGLASWFAESGTKRFAGSKIEIALASDIWAVADADYSATYAEWYALNGLPEKVISLVRKAGNTYRRKADEPPALERWNYLSDGQTLNIAGHEYSIMIGRGHAPDMIMLYRAADKVLIAADQVLPSISPNVSVMPRIADRNPLASFLKCLDNLGSLPEDILVLPSHGIPFYGLHARLQVLAEHHERRLEQVMDACREPCSAFDLFAVLYARELDAQQTAFALGESLAHLHYLQAQGALTVSIEAGVQRFQRS